MKEFYFIRHAVPINDSSGFDLHQFNLDQLGQQDHSLSEIGKQQALSLTQKLKALNIEVIIASEKKRAYETAEIVSRETSIPFIKKYKELNEFAPGGLDLSTNLLLKFLLFEGWPDVLRVNIDNLLYQGLSFYYMLQWKLGKTSQGDNLTELYQNIDRVIREYLKQPYQKIAIISHGYQILLLGLKLATSHPADLRKIKWVSNVSITRIDVDDKSNKKLVYFAENNP